MPEAARERLLALGALREYPPGAALIMQGEPSTEVFVLMEGWAKVVGATEGGGVALLAIRVAGDLVGEQAALDGRPRAASVISSGAAVARVIRQPDFLGFLSESPQTSLAVGRSLSAKLRWATQRRIDCAGMDVGTRLARLLSELARQDGAVVSGGEFGFRLTQPELAAMVGASAPSVHKALRRLRRGGVLSTGYGKVVVLDRGALAAFADGSRA